MTAAPLSRDAAQQALLAQLGVLPDWLALTPVDGEKAAYITGWTDRPMTKEQISAEITAPRSRCRAVGLVCGPASGLLVLDHDGASADRLLLELTGGEPLPPTWIWGSGRLGRWSAAFKVPERYWPALKGIWEKRTDVQSPDDEEGKVEGLEIRWKGCQSVLIGQHPKTAGYTWFGGRSPAEIPEPAEAPLCLIEALLKDPQPEPSPQLELPAPVPSGLRLPLLEFVSRETREFVETGGTPGQWNTDQLKHAQDLIGTERWIQQQGHIAEPSARDAYSDHVAAAARQNSKFDTRKAWRRFEGGLKLDPHPSTPLEKLESRLTFHAGREGAAGPAGGERPAEGAGRGLEAATAPESRKPRLTPAQKLTAMQEMAAALLADGTPFASRVPLLRAKGEELDLTLRDDELRRLIWDARRAAAGGAEILAPGQALDLTPTRWLWEGVVMPAALNLLVALPKVGKTSLALGMLGAWHRGEQSFLGLQLIGPCPPVLIVGTDQPQSDWGRMLQEAGLLEADGIIRAPLVGLAHAGRPLHLSPEGIERIASYAAAHPGLFILLDSIAAVTGPLGIDENSAELAEPIRDLMEAVEPHGATLLALHHSSKGRAGDNATLASRGSSALPAVASQLISLARMASSNPGAPPDRRIVVKTEGRAGEPQHLLIERTAEGWVTHGSAEHVALLQHLQEVEERLNDRQADALEVVRDRWARGERTEATALAAALQLGKDGERKARSTLDQLARKGLLRSATEVGLQGRTKWFWPIGAEGQEGDRRPSRGGLSDASDPSDPSYPPLDQPAPSHTWRDGKEGKEGKEGQENTPRETLRTPSEPPPADSAAASDRIPCLVDGQPGWTRRAGPMPRLSVFVVHKDGSQLSADPRQITDLPQLALPPRW